MKLLSRVLSACSALAVTALGACATPAQQTPMAYQAAAPLIVTTANRGYRSVTAVRVSGGQTTHPLWTSEVSNEGFKGALEKSLQAAGYMGKEGPSMEVSATLLEVDQPLYGFDMKVTSRVRYTVSQQGWPVFDETVTAAGNAGPLDHVVGSARLRIATERSMHSSIENFLAQLRVHELTQ